MARERTTSDSELLLPLARGAGRSLRAQLEDRLRTAIRAGVLPPGSRLPSSRALAGDLGVSRGLVVEAFEQLVAEGYLEAYTGSGTRVAAAAQAGATPSNGEPTPLTLRYDFRPGHPDLSLFPRPAWLSAMRAALWEAPDRVLGYGDPRGAPPLRSALAAYLGRVRGVVADPARVVICGGFAQALGLICEVLRARGIERIAVEDPGHPDPRVLIARNGLTPVPLAVDDDGLRADELARLDLRAVIVTPAHQFPSGVVLAPARRTALIALARERDGFIVEDDYDAEYRYDRAPVGALQGLAPDQVIYAGTASKMLAPALRLGWLVVPANLVSAIAEAKRGADLGSPALEQLAFAHFIESGALDRHLRRMRVCYRERRDALVRALAHHLPEARVRGIAAGLQAVVDLPAWADEQRVVETARHRGVGVYGMSAFRSRQTTGRPALVLGYAALSPPAIAAGIVELAAAVAASVRGLTSPSR